MTNKEAIRRILDHKRVHSLNEPRAVLINEALDLAIKALEERPQGEWKETGYETGALGITYRQTQCSNCGWEHALPMWWNFCPNCGAEMRDKKNEP